MDAESLVIDAFAQLGIYARSATGSSDRGIDVVLDPDGVSCPIQLKQRSLLTDEVAERLLARPLAPGVVPLVVAERVTTGARAVLAAGGWGYLDLRGRLALRTDRLVVDAEVRPVKERPQRVDALAGKVGMEVATALLMRPERPVVVRELARELGRSPSTVSEVLATLRRDEVVDAKKVVAATRLFWQVADRWSGPRELLATIPAPGHASLASPLRLGLEDVEHVAGWALTDSAAAVAYGAPLAFRSGQVLDFFVPDRSVVRRATTLLSPASSVAQAQASVRVAPVPAVVQCRVDHTASPFEWPLAHPLFVALDLAQDVGRGREILKDWTPDDRWTRVW
ncbi:helix-turn-helix domain-containing protein [Georgenia yuyongxinii]|uniref:Helix-turn-helix transcriptional regulator n=1 Tax=Georgenia yuyongxinii TaxID=2589797 RepID=A0A552WY32_9MICO|nr:helix-turn-helix domain-containing protein [Georgenia yuyongxinii]TRW47687.1 helix-turn-helix transcriptional regulator [Georgenia yuyongxinii]